MARDILVNAVFFTMIFVISGYSFDDFPIYYLSDDRDAFTKILDIYHDLAHTTWRDQERSHENILMNLVELKIVSKVRKH